MGIFIEDLLNFGNLIDAELEIKLYPEHLGQAYAPLHFELEDGILRLIISKKVLFFNKRDELRLAEADGKTKKERENQQQWIFMKLLSKKGLEEFLKLPFFTVEDEQLGMDVMPAVYLTQTYQRVPKQFKDRLLISRYRIGRDCISVFFKFEK